MRRLIAPLAGLFLIATPAMANWTGKDAGGSTVTFFNGGNCTSVVCVPVAQPVDSTGASFGVPGNAMLVGIDPSEVGGGVAPASAAITTASAATSQIVALSGSTKIYVTSFDFMAAGTTNVTLVYGSGTNCATGLTALTGVYPLIPQTGISKGSGIGAVLVVPAGKALCITNSAAIQVSGSVSYQQF